MSTVKSGTSSFVLKFPPIVKTDGDLALGLTTSTPGFKLYIEVSGEGGAVDPDLLSSGAVLASFTEGKVSGLDAFAGYSVTLHDTDYLAAGYEGKTITAVLKVQSGSNPATVDPIRSESVKVTATDETSNELADGSITPPKLASSLKPIRPVVEAVVSTTSPDQTTYTIQFEDYDLSRVASARVTGAVKATVKSVGSSPTTILNDVTFSLMTGESTWYYVGTGAADLVPGAAYVVTNITATIDGVALPIAKPVGILGVAK